MVNSCLCSDRTHLKAQYCTTCTLDLPINRNGIWIPQVSLLTIMNKDDALSLNGDQNAFYQKKSGRKAIKGIICPEKKPLPKIRRKPNLNLTNWITAILKNPCSIWTLSLRPIVSTNVTWFLKHVRLQKGKKKMLVTHQAHRHRENSSACCLF